VLRANLKWKLVSQLVGSWLVLMLTIGMTSCDAPGERLDRIATTSNQNIPTSSPATLTTTDGPLSEVNIPESISSLAPSLEKFQPQVQILSPKPDEILSDDRVTIELQVNDLPLFKHPELGLGNHLHVILDKQTYQGVYDLKEPLVFKNLTPGTHSLRVFASRPWHESFKNEGAYAQTTFHVLTKTAENNPDPQKPLLTYSRPVGTYGAEPIMLDYYLTNAPSHLVASGSADSLPDWRIRVTVNDRAFILDRWAPIYLQGFKPGKNWVRLELVDDRGNPIPNVYNDTVGLVNYDPQSKDALAKLIRGELSPNLARALVEPGYVAIEPKSLPAPISTPVPVVTPTPRPSPVAPNPIEVAPAPIITPTPSPIVSPAPISKTVPDRHMNTTIQSPAPTIPVPSTTRVEIDPTPTQSIMPPSIVPSPVPVIRNPAPMATKERPIAIEQPTPADIPSPKVEIEAKPVIVPPPVFTPSPPAPQPTPAPKISPQIAAIDDAIKSSTPSRPSPAPIATTTAAKPQLDTDVKTWQTQAIELLKLAGAKTRKFTNTIPSKAQRFGQNVRVWAGNAMDTIQAWRARNSENQT
jgi:hypothetical protein